MAKTYIAKPKIRQAVQWTGENVAELIEFTDDLFELQDGEAFVYDKLHTTWIRVYLGQWVVKGTEGECYPVAHEVFTKTYQPYDEVDLNDDFFRQLFAEMGGAPS